jgi:hypothetical protein
VAGFSAGVAQSGEVLAKRVAAGGLALERLAVLGQTLRDAAHGPGLDEPDHEVLVLALAVFTLRGLLH